MQRIIGQRVTERVWCGGPARQAGRTGAALAIGGGRSGATVSNRRGYVLVLVGMLLFGLMGLAALVIDVGFVRLTQRQMQTATDAAALEGMRFRDDPQQRERVADIVAWTFDDDLNPDNGDDGAFYDAEYPNPQEGDQFDVAGRFGAGPVLEFTGGAGPVELAASQFINSPGNPNPNPDVGSYPVVPFFKTRLQWNVENDWRGDMVAGKFEVSSGFPSGSPLEDSDYNRLDFDPSGDTAFLVRMRRTNDWLDGDDIVGISSADPPVPMLFGRGSLILPADPTQPNQPRRDGISVRATSIAAVETTTTDAGGNSIPRSVGNVKLAGPAIPGEMYPAFPPDMYGNEFRGIAGVAPFCVAVACVDVVRATGSLPPVRLGTDGQSVPDGQLEQGAVRLCRLTQLTAAVSDTDTTLQVMSSDSFPTPPFTARIGNDELIRVNQITTLGEWMVDRDINEIGASRHSENDPVVLHQTLGIGIPLSEITTNHRVDTLNLLEPELNQPDPDPTRIVHRYVPVFTEFTSPPSLRIVGFVSAESWKLELDADEAILTIDFDDHHVAARNASASPAYAISDDLPADVVAELMQRHGEFGNPVTNPIRLLAPVLVR